MLDPASGPDPRPDGQVSPRPSPGSRSSWSRRRPSSPVRRAASGAWRYLKPMLKQSRLSTKVGVTSFLIQLFALATPILMGVIVDRVVQPPGRPRAPADGEPRHAGDGRVPLPRPTFVRSHLLLALRAQLDMNISTGFIRHLVKLPYQFFLQTVGRRSDGSAELEHHGARDPDDRRDLDRARRRARQHLPAPHLCSEPCRWGSSSSFSRCSRSAILAFTHRRYAATDGRDACRPRRDRRAIWPRWSRASRR